MQLKLLSTLFVHKPRDIFLEFKPSLSQYLLQNTHLDFLPVYVHQPLPEVHPNRGLCLLGELSCAEAVGETGLPDTWISDDDDFEDASPRRRKGRAAQRRREFSRRPVIRHITTAGCRRSSERLVQQQQSTGARSRNEISFSDRAQVQTWSRTNVYRADGYRQQTYAQLVQRK